jgi:hypothetical protein
MRKQVVNFIFLFLLACAGKAQEIATEASTMQNVLNDYQLNDKQFTDWKNVQNSWYANEYDKIKSEYKITMNCNSCSAFYIDVLKWNIINSLMAKIVHVPLQKLRN